MEVQQKKQNNAESEVWVKHKCNVEERVDCENVDTTAFRKTYIQRNLVKANLLT